MRSAGTPDGLAPLLTWGPDFTKHELVYKGSISDKRTEVPHSDCNDHRHIEGIEDRHRDQATDQSPRALRTTQARCIASVRAIQGPYALDWLDDAIRASAIAVP